MNNEKKQNHGPNAVVEKPKNLKLAVQKLLKYLKPYYSAIIISIILASLGAIFSIIGPNKISDLTNKISEGLIIKKDKLNEIDNQILSEINEDSIKQMANIILKLNINKNVLSQIDSNDSAILNNIVTNGNYSELKNLSAQTLNIIIPNEEINGVIVSTADKLTFINIISQMNETSNSKIGKDLFNLPTSILTSMLSDSTIDNVLVSREDKAKFINIISTISFTDSSAYKELDKLPTSIYSIIKPSMDISAIVSLCIFLLVLYLFSALFNFFEGFIMAIVSNKFAQDLRNKISVKINRLPLKYFDNHETGDILSRITNDVDTLSSSLNQSLSSLVGALTLFIGSIIMMFYTNWIMAISAILSSIIGFVLMIIILGKSQKYFSARQKALGKLNAHIEEVYTNHIIVKAYNGEKKASKKFDKLNEAVYDSNFKSQFLSGLMQPIMSFIGNFSYVVVCVVGGLLVLNNQISFGVIVAFIIYVRLFTNPLTQIAQGMTQIQTASASSERVFEFIEEKEMSNEDAFTKQLAVNKVKGNISFDHVKFGYDDNKIIIKDFNCLVKPGEKVAIVGPTGAGKTTMVNLLMKFYNINSGDIKIDGVSIHDLTRENIHDLFIMVLQDTWLFNGTIRDNIKYNKDNISDEKIWQALDVVGVDHFVKSLPETLDYEIKESDSISSGQRQLLTIARGMIKDAPFLILDEATSSVDTRTEELVQKAMDKLTEGRTSFIIAHRLSTIKNANLILVMKDGNIIEQGNHDELIKKNGFYAELYNSQFEN